MTARSPKRLFHLVFESHDKKGLGAESGEKREPVSDIALELLDSLKVLDPDGRLEKRTFGHAPPRKFCAISKKRPHRGRDLRPF